MKRIVKAASDVKLTGYSNWKPVEKKIFAKAQNSTHPDLCLEAATDAIELAGFQFTPEFEKSYNDMIEHHTFYGNVFEDNE